jgi:hypothetical protein
MAAPVVGGSASFNDVGDTIVIGGGGGSSSSSPVAMGRSGHRLLLSSSDTDEFCGRSRPRLGGGRGGESDIPEADDRYRHEDPEPYHRLGPTLVDDDGFAGISASSTSSAHERFDDGGPRARRHHHHLERRQRMPSKPVILLTLLTSLGGVLFGYDLVRERESLGVHAPEILSSAHFMVASSVLRLFLRRG